MKIVIKIEVDKQDIIASLLDTPLKERVLTAVEFILDCFNFY